MYFVGVDAGGTKTEVVVVSEEGEAVSHSIGGSASARSYGVEKALENTAGAVKDALLKTEKKKIKAIFVGLPDFAEELKSEEVFIKKRLERELQDFLDGESKIFIGSDQEVAFRAGTESKNGVVAIAGTGSVTRGWNGDYDYKTGGWGWLVDKSGAFQVGQQALTKTAEAFDKRRETSLLTEEVMRYFNTQSINDINKVVYYKKNHIAVISPLSIVVNDTASKGDDIAVEILKEAAKELAVSADNTIANLNFQKPFPLVLAGSMFKSDIFLDTFKKEIKERCLLAEVNLLQTAPVSGAVKLAREKFNQ